ncbi:MAG TPA: radical SAM protein [Steroidobacteraceae bacterium]|nr:radical SAM protein [Steroidobacteraceae bacterium]
MLSILVCHSYFLRFDSKQVERAKPYPPLATLQVAAMLRHAGHQVALFDAMLAEGIEEYESKLRSVQPQLVLLYEDNFNFLSKMCLAKMRRAACDMITLARQAGARVIASGPDVTDAPEPYLRAGAEFALAGEGLTTLLELLPRLDGEALGAATPNGALIEGLSGVASVVDGRVRKVNGAKVLPTAAQQDEFAAWDLVDMDRYRRMWVQAHGYFSLNMAASRGCPFRCAWCAKPIWGNQYLQRSATRVAQEMTYLRRTFAPDHVWFADDIFGFRVDWVREFAAAINASGGAVPFTIQTRADLLSERMAEALRAAGCREAWLGAESGSQRILDAMNKGTTVSEILTARARLKSVGIRVGFFIQLGYLNEELPDILATRELLETARPDDVGVSVSYPLPGTKFYELVKAQLGDKTHWQDSNDLAMMFRGTYTSDFYRAVRTLLHEQVSLQTRDAAQHSAERFSVERRWQELLAHEHQYRSATGHAPAI